MNYTIYTIEHQKIIASSTDFAETSILRQSLSKHGFEFINTSNCSDIPLEVDIIIFLAIEHDFYKLKYLWKLSSLTREVSSLNPENENTKNVGPYKPILTVFSEDSFESDPNLSVKFGIQYWDSSIWQRWLNIGTLKKATKQTADEYKIRLEQILTELTWYHRHNLYNKIVSREYCDFTTRMYKNSFLLDEGDEHNHSNYVTPFPFLQEGKMLIDRNHVTNLKDQTWKVLMLDDEPEYKLDYLTSILRNYLENDSFGIFEVFTLSANEQFIEKVNNQQFKPRLIIKQVFTIDQAIKELETQPYDVILLDYLLGEKYSQAGGKKERETGMDFLSKLEDADLSGRLRKSVSNKFHIFLTSSYPTAFIDSLQNNQKSLTINNLWNIERGANFMFTPNYFLASFVEFLSNFNNSITRKSLTSVWFDSLVELGNRGNFSRGWASQTLGKILSSSSSIDSLSSLTTDSNTLKHIPNNFADGFYKSESYKVIRKEYDNGLYGYLSHLLFMLSFSNGYEWEEMKTNLEIVKSITRPFASLLTMDATNAEITHKAIGIINDQISNLKDKYDQ